MMILASCSSRAVQYNSKAWLLFFESVARAAKHPRDALGKECTKKAGDELVCFLCVQHYDRENPGLAEDWA